MTKFETLVSPLIGVKFSSLSLQQILNDPKKSYRTETDEEIERISDSNPNRSIFNITKASDNGKLAEIIIREDVTLAKLFEKALKKYHDLYFTPTGDLVEIKRWKQNQIRNNLYNYLSHDAKEYNTSRWLLIFTYDENLTWLEQIVDVEAELKKPSTIISSTFVVKSGQSYTVAHSLFKELQECNANLIFIDENNKEHTKSFDWFNAFKRESKKGFLKGGWYVFANEVLNSKEF